MTERPREKMYREASEKHGLAFSMASANGYVAFDRDEARPADKSEIEKYKIVVDGVVDGKTKICHTLDADVIERNLRWIKRVYAGNGKWFRTENEKIEVDKLTRSIIITQ